MNASQPTHYDVLGLPSSASQDEIKKHYRDLARRHHPDVAKSPEAARFRDINEAHRILSDPTRRANYDAELRLKARLKGSGSASPDGSARQQPHRGSSRPGADRPAGPKPAGKSGHSSNSKPAAAKPQMAEEIDRLLEVARHALSRRRFREADDICRAVLKLDRQNSAAYELLGDASQKRGGVDEAIAMYSYAIQLDRENRSAQQKLDRATGQKSGATMAGSAARASRGAGPLPTRARVPSRAISAIGMSLVLGMVAVVAQARKPMAEGAWIPDWDPLLVLALTLAGLCTGLLARLNGWLDASGQALGAEKPPGSSKSLVPIGLVLGGFSIVLFHASAALYLGIGLILGRTTRSVMAAYGTCYILLLIFAAAGESAAAYIAISGGNLIFPLFLAGWVLADRLQ